MIKLIQGDCLEVMDKLIADGVKVDLTVTSPPYDNLRTYNDTLNWNETIWKSVIDRLYKITADGGVVVWIVNDATINGSETGTSFKQALYFKEIGFNIHDTMIYAKQNPVPYHHNRYNAQFEYMFIFSKGKPNTFNPMQEPTKCLKTGKYRQVDGSMKPANSKIINKTKMLNNIWTYVVGGKKGFNHPAMFPEKLAQDHIISWSNENDIVLDPFLGSGTTGLACKNLNRNFIGIELEETYFKTAEQRISAMKGLE